MGSVGAMARGSADRYFQQEVKDSLKLVPEGIEGQVPYQGAGGRRFCISWWAGFAPPWAMSGPRAIAELQKRAEFIRITNAGLRESHAHDVMITREAPNYQRQG